MGHERERVGALKDVTRKWMAAGGNNEKAHIMKIMEVTSHLPGVDGEAAAR